MGICKHGTRDLIGEMWYRCKTDRAGGFAWAADYIPPPDMSQELRNSIISKHFPPFASFAFRHLVKA